MDWMCLYGYKYNISDVNPLCVDSKNPKHLQVTKIKEYFQKWDNKIFQEFCE